MSNHASSKSSNSRESANKPLAASYQCSTVVKIIIMVLFLISKQGRENGGETASILARCWNTAHSPRVRILTGLENWR